MFQTILFDLDGTLLDTLCDLAAAGNHALAAQGLPAHPVGAYRRMVGNGIPKLIERMLPPDRRDTASHARTLRLFDQYYSAHLREQTTPYPGIPALLSRLRGAGCRLGVLSNKADRFARQMVEDYFPGLFDAVRGLGAGQPPKPDPTALCELMEGLGADPAATLYCGDSDVDIYTAHNAGVKGCGVLWGFRTQKELTGAGADFLAADTHALEGLILFGAGAGR